MKRRQSRNSSEGGNGRKSRAGARKDEEAEIVENPTCPILKKIAQAFVYAKKAVFAEGDGTLGPGSRCIRGMHAPSKLLNAPCGIDRIQALMRGTEQVHSNC